MGIGIILCRWQCSVSLGIIKLIVDKSQDLITQEPECKGYEGGPCPPRKDCVGAWIRDWSYDKEIRSV